MKVNIKRWALLHDNGQDQSAVSVCRFNLNFLLRVLRLVSSSVNLLDI